MPEMQFSATNIRRISLPWAGYIYLCFRVPEAVAQELWAHWGSHDRVAQKSGHITVRQAETSTASD